ncbi:MAG: hypothetical protein J5J00_02800 [Deltaproteobacteria bacterium]|nr:hypothetical protein [Deltaproteobacteria bacterium]
MSSGDKTKKKIPDSYLNQISILKVLAQEETSEQNPRQYQIHEIADMSGLKDERETQRCLFILEGQKLVCPYPPGDFTSRSWHITKQGIKTFRSISRTLTQQAA